MITKQDVDRIARLARIELTDADKASLTADLTRILNHCLRLQRVDTSGVDLDLSETHPVNQTRADEARDSGIQEDILKLAPKRKGKYFEVKGVLE